MSEHKNSKAKEFEVCATRLFAEKGFAGVSVRDICHEMGANCSTVSYYFGGKKGLYAKVLRSQFAVYEEVLDELIARKLSAEEELLALVEKMRQVHENAPYLAALLVREAYFPNEDYEEALREHEAKYQGGYLLNLIIRGQKQGCFDPKPDPVCLAKLLNLLLNNQALAQGSYPAASLKQNDYYQAIKSLITGGLGFGEGERDFNMRRTLGKNSAPPARGRGRGL